MSEVRDQENREGLLARIRRSVVQGPLVPRTDRDRKWIVFNTLILHFRPIRVPEKTIRYTHTWGLGGMSATLFLLLVLTGLLLIFVYEPSPGLAYDSVVSLQNDVLFGKLIRNIHFWSANFLILTVGLHLLRVYLTGAYHEPRQLNWVIGLSLLTCILISNLTGYLLPWDQLSYWATTIVTGMIGHAPVLGPWLQGLLRGGAEIGSRALIRFYAAHTSVLPTLILALMALHFWRIRKAKGVVIPRSPGEEMEEHPRYVLTLPHLLFRELSVALVLGSVIMVFALFFDAPLGDPANPGMSPNPAKAPWYFQGIQELQLHFHPVFSVFILPLLAAVGLLLVPYYRYQRTTPGVFMMSHRGRRLGLSAALLALLLTPLLVVADELWIDWGAWLPGVPPLIGNGILPAAMLVGGLIGFQAILRRRYSASDSEVIQSSIVLLLVAYVILTITGVWFRGPGMALAWPWGV